MKKVDTFFLFEKQKKAPFENIAQFGLSKKIIFNLT